ncbi:MAG: DinB family protein [Gemmatimonadaceae bacterium]
MSTNAVVLTPTDLLNHWQGHRRVTRRIIDAFPDDKLFTYSVGGMRTFGVLANEMLGMTIPMVSGALTGEWKGFADAAATTKTEVLKQWDATTDELNSLWPKLSEEKMQETITAFGQYTDKLVMLLLYVIDNEVHHRGQGYVYLRSLGIEPPAFWDRS